MSFYVYTYADPSRLDRHGQAQRFYVGKGHGYRITRRRPKDRGRFCARYLGQMSCEPIADKFDCASEREAFELERFLISEIGRRDLRRGPLTNLTDGGDGVSGMRHGEESRAAISAAHRGRKLTDEHRAKISAGNRGKNRAPEVCADMSARRRGKPLAMETRAKMSEVRLGKTRTEESRARMSVAQKARTWKPGPGTRAKMAAAKLGRALPIATRIKMAASGLLRRARERGEAIPIKDTPEYIAMRDALILKLSGT